MNRKIQKAHTKVADGSANTHTNSVFKRRMKDAWETTKSVGRFARKHPILTVSLIATAVSGSANVANAQTTADSLFAKEKFRTGTVAPPSAFPNEKIHNLKPTSLTPRILGSENFDSIELKDGVLYIKGAKYNNEKADLEVNLKGYISDVVPDSVRTKFPEKIPSGAIPTEMEGKRGLYLIYDQAVIWLPGQKGDNSYAAWTDDKLFLNKEATYLSPQGYLVMTSPTCLVIIAPKHGGTTRYKKSLGTSLALINPKLRGIGNTVDLKDEATMDGVKIRVLIGQNIIEVVKDNEPLSSLR